MEDFNIMHAILAIYIVWRILDFVYFGRTDFTKRPDE